MRFVKNGLMLLGVLFIASILINAVQTDELQEKKVVEEKQDAEGKYSVYALDIPEQMNFAGEEVPIDNPDIRERIDKELLVNTYWQSNALLLMKRSKKYFPIIEPILKEHGIPDDFKYLAVAESGLQNVVSPARATGYWQILKTTAREYGLEVNTNVDERYHIKKSTEVACRYLKKAKEKFGSWTLAAAAYNAGRGGVINQQQRQQATNYYDLLLGEETGRYVFRILAMKEILSNPEKYGFYLEKDHYYSAIPTFEVEVDTAVTNFADFAQKFEINYKILKIHNPWLREAFLNNKSRKKYKIEIPEKGYYQLGQ
ncbi:transglycosylase SLT domain-containing protein [Leptobacterium flavescens]|uniref:Transglycosylase SLT domain-containing protein n=1 Tax=Leptobacterium flavescens TaxID=472055 RepID=A0A6P0UH83_9FLAO|nr:lytic transglycosylase domain-containing protein [Leptobacterium flavescens]NER11992.1 transglycosylase SLT domain-containing protein [Leptobacterium flavescens]